MTHQSNNSAVSTARKNTLSDFNEYRSSLIEEIKQNSYHAPTGVSFRASQLLLSKEEGIGSKRLMSWRNRSQTKDATHMVINPYELNDYATKLTEKIYEIRSRAFYPLLGYIRLCLIELGFKNVDFTILLNCAYNHTQQQFENVAKLEVKLIRREGNSKSYNSLFSKMANLLVSHFSTKQVTPRVSTIFNSTGIYHYQLNFEFSIFAFLKRLELKRLETCVYQQTDAYDSEEFNQSVKQWIRKLNLESSMVTVNNLRIEFEVDELNKRQLIERDNQSQFVHSSNNIEVDTLFDSLFSDIKAGSAFIEKYREGGW